MSTPLRFILAYLAVLLIMLGWWQLLLASADSDLPWLAVVVAFAGPTAALVLIVAWGRRGARHRL